MKATVTTKCPDCGNEWTREMYVEGIIGGCCLELCPECCPMDEHGNPIMIIELTKRYK
jgi:hypothetical protein